MYNLIDRLNTWASTPRLPYETVFDLGRAAVEPLVIAYEYCREIGELAQIRWQMYIANFAVGFSTPYQKNPTPLTHGTFQQFRHAYNRFKELEKSGEAQGFIPTFYEKIGGKWRLINHDDFRRLETEQTAAARKSKLRQAEARLRLGAALAHFSEAIKANTAAQPTLDFSNF